MFHGLVERHFCLLHVICPDSLFFLYFAALFEAVFLAMMDAYPYSFHRHMTQHDVATKQDLSLLEERLNVRIKVLFEEANRENQRLAMETRRHFDVVAENMHYDLIRGALHDKVSQHDDRILVLEKHVGIK